MKHDTGTRRDHIIAATIVALTLVAAQGPLRGQSPTTTTERPSAGTPPTITVTGDGQSSAPADRAVLHLGAVAQAEQASVAQERVNNVMREAIGAVRGVIEDEKKISTAGISLLPVYAGRQGQPPDQQPAGEPRIVGYRASNRLRVVVDDLSKVGPVIDAGVREGANQVEGLSFELKDDAALRREALSDAARQAGAKADALAAALGVRIEGVVAVHETGVGVVRPRVEFSRAAAAMETATPVQPGNVEVNASVMVTYRISPGSGTNR